MPRGRPRKVEIELSKEQQEQSNVIAQSRSLSHGVVRRAEIILRSAQGESNSAIAERFGLSIPTIGHWRKRFLDGSSVPV